MMEADMKILMTTDTAGGVWHYSIDLAACLLKEQVQVVLVAMGPKPSEAQRSDLKQCRKIRFYNKVCKLEWMDNAEDDVRAAGEWLKKMVDKEKPDLLHFNNYAHVDMDWDCPAILVGHSCITSWWEAVKHESLPERFGGYYRMVRQAFHKADAVVAPTAAMLGTFKRLYGEMSDSRVIYNALAPSTVSTEKEPVIFSMGRLWDEAKNIDLLLRAAPAINAKIYIAGDAGDREQWPANITFLGEISRPEVFGWLNISSLYVLPVKYEPFGLSFLEAASRHCALVGGDIPTLRELWAETMSYVDPDDVDGLAHVCNTLLSNNDYCVSMADEAYQKAQSYTLDRMKSGYLELYEHVMSGSLEAEPVDQ